MGSRMQAFIANLGWASLGSFGSAGFLFLTNMFAGRWLGPSEYGKYSMVIYLGNFLTVPMIVGLNTSVVKHLAATQKPSSQNKIIANTLLTVSLFTIATILILTLNHSLTNKFFNITNPLLTAGTIYSILLVYKLINEAILKGKFLFKSLAGLDLISSIVIFFTLFAQVFFVSTPNFQIYAKSTIIGLIVYTLLASTITLKSLSFKKICLPTISTLLSYSKYAVLGSLSGLLIGNVDKIVLNHYLGFGQVGLYSVYLNASTTFSSIFFPLFLNVYFPSISRLNQKTHLINKLKTIFFKSFFPLFILNYLIILLSLFILGNQYEINLGYTTLFSLQNVILIFANILWWSINSFGTEGIRYTSLIGLIIGGLNILLTVSLVRHLGVSGIIIASTITYSTMVLIAVQKLQHLK